MILKTIRTTFLAFLIVLSTFALCTGTASAASPSSSPRWFQPMVTLPYQPTIRCILYTESHSTYVHPNLGDTDPYQFGPLQFNTILWNRWAWVAGVGHKASGWYLGTQLLHAVTIPAYRATLYEQAKVFATVARNDGLGMWTNFDNC